MSVNRPAGSSAGPADTFNSKAMGATPSDTRPEGFTKEDCIMAVAMILLLLFAVATSKHQSMETDFRYRHEGSVVALYPLTDAARTWCSDNLPEQEFLSPDTFIIELRFFNDIMDGIMNASLTINPQ